MGTEKVILLTRCGLVTQYDVTEPLNTLNIGSGNCLLPVWCHIISWTMRTYFQLGLRNKRKWNLNQNTNILIEENEFQYVVCKMLAILFGP